MEDDDAIRVSMLNSLLSFVSLLPRRLRGWAGLARLSVRDRSALVLVAGAVAAPAFFFLYGLGGFPLRDNNEGLYAEIAREMLADGNWIVPHLNGVPYIEKPPVLYWLQALAMGAFGVTPGVARLASAVPLLALALGLGAFGARHASLRVGCLASVVLASMVPLALGAHLVLFDPLLCALVGGCLLCLLHGSLAASSSALRWGAFLLALAVLEKGAVALALVLGTYGLFLMLSPRSLPRRGAWLPIIALALALSLPWHLLAAWHQPAFAWFYVINEHVLRFLGRRQPNDYHHGPLWFYAPRLLLLVAPWTPFLALLPWRALPGRTLPGRTLPGRTLPGRTLPGRTLPGRTLPGRHTMLLRLCQAGTILPFLFFSLCQAKADYYLMVCTPFLALWLALGLDRAIDTGAPRAGWCWAAAVASCLVLMTALPGSEGRRWSPLLVTLLALGWLCVLVLGARYYATLASAQAREGAVLAWTVHHAAARGGHDSSRHIAELIQNVPGPRPAVFLYRDFEDRLASLPFYLQQRVPLIDSASRDLQFGCRVAPGAWCIDHDAFLRQLGAGPVAVAVHASRRAEFLSMAGPGWRSVAVDERIVFFHG
jgi:4-amino-4-deoxy-L-arabinose transferase-like glycosyltransferase